MSKTINSKLLIRRDTSTNWSTNNPILLAGEIGFDTTIGKHKIGDGTHHWNDLSYFALVSDLQDIDIVSNNNNGLMTSTMYTNAIAPLDTAISQFEIDSFVFGDVLTEQQPYQSATDP